MSKATASSIGVDLKNLAIFLKRHNLCKDTSPLESAGNYCMSRSTKSKWIYNLNKIIFEVDKVGGTIPEKVTDISVSLTINIEGLIDDSKDIIDPLDKLAFNIEIDAFKLNDNLDSIYASWHLDRHLSSDTDSNASYTHPFYHFTFGGMKMEAKGDVYGASIILPSPRLPYPPMDAVLGIDFILQNYLHKDKIKKLINDPDYSQIVRKSQIRLWKPYYTSPYSFWGKIENSVVPDFSPLKLMPLFY